MAEDESKKDFSQESAGIPPEVPPVEPPPENPVFQENTKHLEKQWQAAESPQEAFSLILGREIPNLNRKLRIFMCACCRRIFEFMPASESRWAVEVAEKYNEGEVTEEELCKAGQAAMLVAEEYHAHNLDNPFAADAASFAATLLHDGTWNSLSLALNCSVDSVHTHVDAQIRSGETDRATIRLQEILAHTDLLREIFGNPFNQIEINPVWLAWNDKTIPRIANTIYEEQVFDSMPILADSLEDAGCTDKEILNHCRVGGPHIRGCWLLDLILQKK